MKNQRLPDVPDSLCSDFIEQAGKLFPGDSSTIYVYCHRYWSKGDHPAWLARHLWEPTQSYKKPSKDGFFPAHLQFIHEWASFFAIMKLFCFGGSIHDRIL